MQIRKKPEVNNRLNSKIMALTSATARIARRYLGGWKDVLGLFFLLFTLGIAVESVQRAEWISPQPSLILVLVLSSGLAVFLVKSGLRFRTKIILGVVAGILVTIWQATKVQPPPPVTLPFLGINESLISLLQALIQNTPNQGTIYFAAFMIIISGAVGFISTWLLIRKQSVWPAVFLGFILLLVNLEYLSKDAYGSFFLYLFIATIFVGYVHFSKQEAAFRVNTARFPGRIALWFISGILIVSMLMVFVSWAAPEIRANQLQTVADSKVLLSKTLDNLKINFFAPVKAKGSIIKSADQSKLYFTTPPDLSTDVQFNVRSAQTPSYWRVRRYDFYNSWGWNISPYRDTVVDRGISQKEEFSQAAKTRQIYIVIDKLKTDIVLVAGQFISSDNPVLIHTLASSSSGDLTSGPASGSNEFNDMVTSVTAPRVYKPEEKYTVTVSVGKPSPAQLSTAGAQYPEWISTYYLQLPTTLPQNVRRISQTITRNMPNPYSKTIAVRNYLSQFEYNISGSFPPQGADAVDNFLTTQKSGNCTNFATAAVVLLRAAGVPARLCTGYLPHLWNKEDETFVIQARDYHAWPEVYFPDYGWVEFEVTPNISTEVTSTDDSSQGNSPTTGFDENLFAIGDPGVEAPPSDESGGGVVEENFEINPAVLASLISALVIVLAAAFLVRRWYRRFYRSDYALEAWGKLCYFAAWSRLAPQPYQTPLEYGNHLIEEFPDKEREINTLTEAFVLSRFSQRKGTTEHEKVRIRQSWRSMFWTLVNHRLTSF